jgi:CelD/BcsL family acetyltransferase involved in cellulose biosynthesis
VHDRQAFTVEDLARLAPAWDRAVEVTPDADAFCTSSAWSFSAATSFPHAGPPVLVGDGRAFCGLRSAEGPDGTRMLLGLDPVWGFATPVVGPPVVAAQSLRARLALEDFDVAVVAGQREDSALTACIVRALGRDHRLLRGPEESRLRVDLAGGLEPWWQRRSPRFRQRIRRLRRQAEDRGLDVVDVSALPPADLFDRVLRVEARSWKGPAGTGLQSPDLSEFYGRVCARLAATDQLRALLARLGGEDVGYVLGGTRGGTYRGLQISFDRSFADLGIGHLLQLAQLEMAAAEGIATYDLGMDMEYKRRWADRSDDTFALVVTP